MEKTTDFIQENFLRYATAVAQSRALVDVRDFIKPSMRGILYANYTDGFVAPARTKKFQKLIGSATRFYWHGKRLPV